MSLLALQVGDYRWATEEVELEGEVFEAVLPLAGYELSLERELGPLAFTLDIPLSLEDVSGLSRGDRFVLYTVENEQAEQLWTGRVTELAAGAQGSSQLELGTFSIPTESTFPLASQRITVDTWPDAPEDSLGQWYPFPVGRPGVAVLADETRYLPGSPAFLIDPASSLSPRLLIAGDWIDDGEVWITTSDTPYAWETGRIAHNGLDGLGQRIAYVELDGPSGSYPADESAQYWICWAGSARGVLGPDGRSISSATQLAEYVCGEEAEPFAPGAFSAFEDQPVDGYLSSPIAPAAWVLDQLSAEMGWVWRWGPFGLCRQVNTPATVWGEDEDFWLAEDARLEDAEEAVNGWEVAFAIDEAASNPVGSLTVGGDNADETGAAIETSRNRHGVRSASVTLSWCWTLASAAAAVHRRAELQANPGAQVKLETSQVVQPGQRLELTSPTLRLWRRPALVRAVSYGVPVNTVTVELLYQEVTLDDSPIWGEPDDARWELS